MVEQFRPGRVVGHFRIARNGQAAEAAASFRLEYLQNSAALCDHAGIGALIGQVWIGLDASCREPLFSDQTQPFSPAGGQIKEPGRGGDACRRDKAGSASERKAASRSRREPN